MFGAVNVNAEQSPVHKCVHCLPRGVNGDRKNARDTILLQRTCSLPHIERNPPSQPTGAHPATTAHGLPHPSQSPRQPGSRAAPARGKGQARQRTFTTTIFPCTKALNTSPKLPLPSHFSSVTSCAGTSSSSGMTPRYSGGTTSASAVGTTGQPTSCLGHISTRATVGLSEGNFFRGRKSARVASPRTPRPAMRRWMCLGSAWVSAASAAWGTGQGTMVWHGGVVWCGVGRGGGTGRRSGGVQNGGHCGNACEHMHETCVHS
jgi:hypothetical protein